MSKPARTIPGTVTKVDMTTGKETSEPMAWHIVPPPKDACQICAVKHPPDQPHNAQSLYYQMAFQGIVGRPPTWADAIAHCDERLRKAWQAALREKQAWTEPPAGEQPVKHHGLEPSKPSDAYPDQSARSNGEEA